jgi:hypothetical protein
MGQARDEEEDEDRPRRRRRDDEYEEEDRPRRRKRDEGDATGGLIPYKNGKALAAYYTGVFSLIPCLGAILGPIAVVLGIMGLKYAKKHPIASGQAHAVVGIVLGGLTALGNIGGAIALIVSAALSR